jgi:hypothetical protein
MCIVQDKYRFFQDYGSEIMDYNNLPRIEESHDVITFHPVKEPSLMLRLHYFIENLKLKSLQSRIEHTLSELQTVCASLGPHHITDNSTARTNCSRLLIKSSVS